MSSACAPAPARPGGGQLAVEPFALSAPVPAGWDSEAFADSLARALSADLAEPVRVVGEGPGAARWILRGDVTLRDRRLVIRATLQDRDSTPSLWSATFWRDTTDGHSVIEQLVAGTSEALRTRRAAQAPNGRP